MACSLPLCRNGWHLEWSESDENKTFLNYQQISCSSERTLKQQAEAFLFSFQACSGAKKEFSIKLFFYIQRVRGSF